MTVKIELLHADENGVFVRIWSSEVEDGIEDSVVIEEEAYISEEWLKAALFKFKSPSGRNVLIRELIIKYGDDFFDFLVVHDLDCICDAIKRQYHEN